MSTRDERLEELIRKASEATPVPEFERTWRGAIARAGAGKDRGSLWRWAAGPVLAAVSIAVVAMAVYSVHIDENTANPAAIVEALPSAVLADAGASPVANPAKIVANTGSTSAAVNSGLYVGGTDFLLNMNIPAWN
jgi:hypothetical protein